MWRPEVSPSVEAWLSVSDDWQTEEADGGIMIIDVDVCQDLTGENLVPSTLGVSDIAFY